MSFFYKSWHSFLKMSSLSMRSSLMRTPSLLLMRGPFDAGAAKEYIIIWFR